MIVQLAQRGLLLRWLAYLLKRFFLHNLDGGGIRLPLIKCDVNVAVVSSDHIGSYRIVPDIYTAVASAVST